MYLWSFEDAVREYMKFRIHFGAHGGVDKTYIFLHSPHLLSGLVPAFLYSVANQQVQ